MAGCIAKNSGRSPSNGWQRRKGEKAMMSYEAKRAYQKRLQKVIFHSADVLPVEVAAYLKEIATHGSAHAIEEALETYRPLVDHLAKDYVDFALQMLIMNPEEHDTDDILRRSSF